MNADEADKLAKAQHEVDNLARAQQDACLDKLVSALLMYWNALLTGNGLLLATLSIIGSLPGHVLDVWYVRFVVPLVLCFNLFAILGLLWCFKSERDHHFERLPLMMKPPETEEESSRILALRARTLYRKKWRKRCEIFAVVTIIASTVLLIVIVLSTR